jgi:hypothetical protein
VLRAVDPCIHVAPVARRASAVGHVGAAHIADADKASASQSLAGHRLAVASRCERREPGEHARRPSHVGEAAAAKSEAGWRRNGERGANGERPVPR